MCGGSVWDFERWRPFKQFLDDVLRADRRDVSAALSTEPKRLRTSIARENRVKVAALARGDRQTGREEPPFQRPRARRNPSSSANLSPTQRPRWRWRRGLLR